MTIIVTGFHRFSHVKMAPPRALFRTFVILWTFFIIVAFMCFVLLFDRTVSSDMREEIDENAPIFPTTNQHEQAVKRNFARNNFEFDILIRNIRNGIMELKYAVDGQFKKMPNMIMFAETVDQLKDRTSQTADLLKEQINLIMQDVQKLSDDDNVEKYRQSQLSQLTRFVQKRIYDLQNPENCTTVKKSVCGLSKDSTGDTILLPIIDEFDKTDMINYLPQHIPTELSEKLQIFHSAPTVWWIGQFVRYLMHYQLKTDDKIEILKNEMKFEHPIVGVHIRRTDKIGTEATYHPVEEYMKHVEEWYETNAVNSVPDFKKTIFLATDDANVYEEIKGKYPDYKIITNVMSASSAQLDKRYSESSLTNLIVDVHFLSQSSHIVCTFSSQICRVAYELMQTAWPSDAGQRFTSLDDVYYFGGQNPPLQKVIFEHKPKDNSVQSNDNAEDKEIELQLGDRIILYGNHWDGFSKGMNIRTLKTGIYPTYKVRNEFRLANYSLLQP